MQLLGSLRYWYSNDISEQLQVHIAIIKWKIIQETEEPLGSGTAALCKTYHGVFHYINERDDVGTSPQVLQNLDFTLDFLFLDGLKRRKVAE